MDIKYFINSDDIKRVADLIVQLQCDKDIPALYAWLIWQSRYAAISEKHAAWQKVMDIMPDCSMSAYCNNCIFSLHEFIQKYISVENKVLTEFERTSSEAYYTYSTKYPNEELVVGDIMVYSSLKECLDSLIKANDATASEFYITKQWRASEHKWIMITMSAVNHSFMSFNQNGVLNDEDDELLDVFPRMWIDIWHPFQRGDILKFRTNKCDAPEYLVFDGTSDDFDTDDGSEALNAIIINKPSGTHMMSREAPGDSTAMVGYGYFLLPGGQIIYSSVPNYLNLERCNEKLSGNLRILTAISNYLEGKISVDILLNAYYIIRQEGQAMVERSLMNERQMMLTLAGLGNDS